MSSTTFTEAVSSTIDRRRPDSTGQRPRCRDPTANAAAERTVN
jgi:hypothetical protein